MKSVLITTRSNAFFEVFCFNYHLKGGLPFDYIVCLPDRTSSFEQRLVQLIILINFGGSKNFFPLIRKKIFPNKIDNRLRSIGFHLNYTQGVRLLCPDENAVLDVQPKDLLDVVSNIEPDLLVSVGAPLILGADILKIPKIAAINVHNGQIPNYRGHFSTFWELNNGDEFGYTSVHEMSQKVDTGRLLSKRGIKFSDYHCILDIIIEKKKLGGELLADVINLLAKEGKANYRGPYEDKQAIGKHYNFPSLPQAFKFRSALRG